MHSTQASTAQRSGGWAPHPLRGRRSHATPFTALRRPPLGRAGHSTPAAPHAVEAEPAGRLFSPASRFKASAERAIATAHLSDQRPPVLPLPVAAGAPRHSAAGPTNAPAGAGNSTATGG